MDNKLLQEISAATKNFDKTFSTTKEFYEYLKTQGVTASLEDVRNVLIDLNKQSPKQELSIENSNEVVGGAQVEVKNNINNNSKPVNVGKTVVINV